MRKLLQRPALAFVLGGIAVGVVFAGTTAYAKITATTANTITALLQDERRDHADRPRD